MASLRGGGIADVYDGKTIFLTGATGFLGRMILEKLLRTCHTLEKIYILIRKKKGKEENERFDEIFSGPIWEPLNRKGFDYKKKVSVLTGDLLLPKLGMEEKSIEILKNEVNIIIHCAATVRFDQHIKNAAYINVRSVKDLVEIGKDMKKLDAFLYISTAYSNSPRKTINEVFYEPPMNHKNLLELVDLLSDEKLKDITPHLIEKWPNTYTFTKAIAEGLIKEAGKELPLVVVRPTIVLAAVSEPLSGWIDNLYGPSGIFLATALGVMRCFRGKMNNIGDMVPSDYAVNCMLASIAYRCKNNLDDVPIFNFCSSSQAPVSWEQYTRYTEQAAYGIPSPHIIWAPMYTIISNKYRYRISVFFLHTLPAYVMDIILRLKGQQPKAVEGYQKINKLGNVLSYFALREWDFKNENTRSLWNGMNEEDKRLFPFSMANFDWEIYFDRYIKGIRIYLLKDPMETIPEGQKKLRKVQVAHYSLLTVLFLMFLFFLRVVLSFFW